MSKELLTPEIANQLGPFELGYTSGLVSQLENAERVLPIIGQNIELTAFLSDYERRHEFGVTGNKEIEGRPEYLQTALDTVFVNHNLDAGLGSSILRDEYLRRIAPFINRGAEPVIGSKSTDLYRPHQTPDAGTMYVNVAEIKLNRVAKESSKFKKVELRPIVNDESLAPMESLYEMESFTSKVGQSEPKTYRQELDENDKMTIGDMLVQVALPTLDKKTGKLTLEKKAPGGHGQAAAMVLHEIANTPQDGQQRVRGIYNGDGPGNFYSAEMVGFTAQEAAIVMIVTPTGPGDVKGGKTALKALPNGRRVPYMLEVAQAKEAKQEDLFQAAGQKEAQLPQELADIHHPEGQYFNTNNVLLSDHFMGPFLNRIREELGEDFYNQALTPEFFPKDDGAGHIQLEGAMGSLMLRLNEIVATDERVRQIWQEVGEGRTFLKFINVESEDRDKYFGPIKFPVDFILQFYSDHFMMDEERWMPINNRPGHLPHFGGDFIGKNTFYADVWNCMQAFGENSQIQQLDSMDVKGKILFANGIHGGHEHFESRCSEIIDLNSPQYKIYVNGPEGMDRPLQLADKHIIIDELGNITVH